MPVSMKSWWMSRRRQGVLFRKYSDCAVAEDAARDADLVPFDAEFLLAFRKSERDLRHAERLAGIGAAKNDVSHFAAAQRLGRLLAEHPADGIEHVRFAAAVRPDHGGHAAMEVQNVFWAKDLNPRSSSD